MSCIIDGYYLNKMNSNFKFGLIMTLPLVLKRFVENKLTPNNYKLIGEYNLSADEKRTRKFNVTVECPKKHHLTLCFNSIRQKTMDDNFCTHCVNEQQADNKFEKNKDRIFEKTGHTLLTIDLNRKCTYQCGNCGSVQNNYYHNFLYGDVGRECIKCSQISNRNTYEKIIEICNAQGVTCLLGPEDYKCITQPIPLLCICGKEWSCSVKDIRKGHKCPRCKFERVQATCLERYGENNVAKTIAVKEKMKSTNLERHGVEYPQQNPNIRTKTEETCLAKYGTRWAFAQDWVYDKIKLTMMDRYGVEHGLQNATIQKKAREIFNERWGAMYPFLSGKYQDMIEAKYGKRFYGGTDNWLQKIKDKYGVENPFMSEECKKKSRETCLERYGVEYPMHSAEIFAKVIASSFRTKMHTLPDGSCVRVMGYEGRAIEEILGAKCPVLKRMILSHEIETEQLQTFEYYLEGKKHVYHPDIHYKDTDVFTEVKSVFTYNKDIEKNLAKWRAVAASGKIIIIRVYNAKERVALWILKGTKSGKVATQFKCGDVLPEKYKKMKSIDVEEYIGDELLTINLEE